MAKDAKATVQLTSDGSDLIKRTIASMTIFPEDHRPLVVRRWSATALDNSSVDSYHWRARSKEEVMAKGIETLRNKAPSGGIKNPLIVVNDAASNLKIWISVK